MPFANIQICALIAILLLVAARAAERTCQGTAPESCQKPRRASDSILLQLQVVSPLQVHAQCEIAVEGSACYVDVIWAMQTGIYSNPDWYPGLSASSSFIDFQLFMHRSGTNGGVCPEPCQGESEAAGPAPSLVPSPVPVQGAVPYCGIAVDVYECRTEVNRLTAIDSVIGQDFDAMCMGYGGTHPPAHLGKTVEDKDMCTLNMNNDCDHWYQDGGSWHCAKDYGLSKNPDDCLGRYLFLWDEPMTQGKDAEWAADQWKMHVDRWDPEIAALRARGTRITSPLFTDHGGPVQDKFRRFFAHCGSGCSEPNSKYYIDVLATNQWLQSPQSDHRSQEQWIKDLVREIRQDNGNRPVILGNFAWIGAHSADEQAEGIASSRIWDKTWSGLEAVFYFAATDYGGGTTNNFLSSTTSSGSTIGESLISRCRAYSS